MEYLSQAWRNWRAGTTESIVDPAISDGSRNEIMRCIHIGMLCVQENSAERPTMASVEVMLNSYSVTFPLPSPPASYLSNRNFSYSKSDDYSSLETTRPSKSENQYDQTSAE